MNDSDVLDHALQPNEEIIIFTNKSGFTATLGKYGPIKASGNSVLEALKKLSEEIVKKMS